MNKLKTVISYIWQLPQHLAGFVLIRILNATKAHSRTADITYMLYYPRNRFGEYISGVSLGKYIILKTTNDNTIKHEYGHSIQSRKWGWLYLFVIGIPSVANNLWDRYFHKKWSREKRIKWYYSRWPEKQADLLGKVYRFSIFNKESHE